MAKLTPYLLFEGTCGAAMEFYRSCFGGELSLTRVGESPMKAQLPATLHDRVINARLLSGAVDLSASDWLHPTRTSVHGNTVCLYITGADDDLRSWFERLSPGATLVDPFIKLPFGLYGALTDKFGVRWMFRGDS